ncbi:MAG: PilZ domain-containing protein [Aeromonadaceae bacterium]
MDAEKPHPLLEQLLPLLYESDFDTLFANLTQGESNNTRFLLKMELKRLAAPCVRSIDLRARHNAVSFVHSGIQHFMTPEDIEVFHAALTTYHGQYTLGVYEAVMAAQKERLQQDAQQEDDPQHDPTRFELDAIHFASYYHRREERMHFSSPVILRLGDHQTIQAKTSDISPGGLRLLMSEPVPFEVGDLCQITFTGLQKEAPAAVIEEPVYYQILGEELRDNRFWLKLLRADADPELDRYLHHFIEANKLRYRVSIDYLLSSVEVKGYEQYYLPRMTGLPLFFGKDPAARLLHVLKSENNQPVLEYWRDERNIDRLSGLFNPLRMERLLAQPQSHKQCWIYCFTHTVRSHIYFFSATSDELEHSGLRDLFFTVGAKRPSWRVFKLDLEAIQLNEQGLKSLINIEDLPPAHVASVEQQLAQFGYVGQLTAIDDDAHRPDYLAEAPSDPKANQLHMFAHDLEVPEFELELLHYVQLRKERRYLHKSAIAVKHGAQTLVGWTRDISTQGLQIELEQPLACQNGDIIRLTLPKLQALTREMKLDSLPYKVVHSNAAHTVLNLSIHGEAETHIGRRFFQLLIDSNPDKLKLARELKRLSGMARALRNLFTYHLFNTPLYLSKNKPNRLGMIGCIDKPRAMQSLLSDSAIEKPFNVMPLFQGDLLKRILLIPLRQLHRNDAPRHCEVFISRQHDRQGNLCYTSKLESDFPTTEAKRQFVRQARQQGRFYSVRLHLSRTGRPDIDFIAGELDYVAKYAIHKARQLEDSLWSIIGICDMMDTTQATLFRLKL